MTHRVLYVLACLVVPVLWGVVVHNVFRRFHPTPRTPVLADRPSDLPPIEYHL